MKTFVGYSIWNKVDMLSWLLEGIVNNFNPEETEVGFCFEGCRDDSVIAFDAMRRYWLDSRGYRVHRIISEKEVGQVGGHNLLLKQFMDTECAILLAPQDDQRVKNPISQDLEILMSKYGSKLGVVGGRYGFNGKSNHMQATCPWSPVSGAAEIINTGHYVERLYLNDGQIGRAHV